MFLGFIWQCAFILENVFGFIRFQTFDIHTSHLGNDLLMLNHVRSIQNGSIVLMSVYDSAASCNLNCMTALGLVKTTQQGILYRGAKQLCYIIKAKIATFQFIIGKISSYLKLDILQICKNISLIKDLCITTRSNYEIDLSFARKPSNDSFNWTFYYTSNSTVLFHWVHADFESINLWSLMFVFFLQKHFRSLDTRGSAARTGWRKWGSRTTV